MTRPRFLLEPCLVLALLALGLVSLTACGRGADSAAAYLSVDLVDPAGGAAHGRVTTMLSRLLSQIDVVVQDLAPDTTYEISADGAGIARFDTDASGAAHVQLSPYALALDPRGSSLAVREPGGPDVLVSADPDTTPGSVIGEHAPLSAIAGEGLGTTSFAQYDTGLRRFRVHVEGVPPDSYEVWVDGVERTTLDASSGEGDVTFSSDPGPGEELLDFDPRTSLIEIRRGDDYFFVGSGHAEIVGVDVCTQSRRDQQLLAAQTGEGVASLATRSNCLRNFTVTVGDVPMGDYNLYVDGELRGTISVGADENGVTEGDLTFVGGGGESGLDLDFDPVGAPIEVRQGNDVLFWLDAFNP